jgi:hypothetical protein
MVAFDRNRGGGKRLRAFERVGWLFDEGWLRGAFASTIGMGSDFNAAAILCIGYWGLVCWYCAATMDTLPLINLLLAFGVVRHVGWAGAWIKEWKRFQRITSTKVVSTQQEVEMNADQK